VDDIIVVIVVIIFVLQLPHPCDDELMAKGVDAMTVAVMVSGMVEDGRICHT